MSHKISFRGMLADGAQERISLQTNDGSTGYRIVKFAIINNAPGTVAAEGIVKLYKVKQTAIDNKVDFSDNTLLGVGYWVENNPYNHASIIVFDSEIFNQDIYVTAIETLGSEPMNYVIELEQMDLDLHEATVATLKDIRNND